MNFSSQLLLAALLPACLPPGLHHAVPGPGCFACFLAAFQRREERRTAGRSQPGAVGKVQPSDL